MTFINTFVNNNSFTNDILSKVTCISDKRTLMIDWTQVIQRKSWVNILFKYGDVLKTVVR